MRLVLNGRERDVPDGLSVAGLLAYLNLDPGRVVVEVNRVVVGREAYETTRVKEGDAVEVVEVVGGG